MKAYYQLIPIILMFAVLYFVMIVPEKKRKKKYDAMLSELQVNDDVMTRGGIIGRIISMDDEYIILESGSDRTRIKFSKSAVSSKINKDK